MRRVLLTAVLLPLVALLSACGGGDEQGGPSTAPPTGPEQAPVALSGGSTTLAVDIQTAGVLADNGLEIAAVPPAQEVASGVRDTRLRFPISGGEIQPQTLTGRVQHRGGLSVSDGRHRVVFRDLVINLTGRQLIADAGTGPIPLLNLEVDPGKVSAQGGVIELSGIGATLTATAARAVSDVLTTAVLRAQEIVGTVTIEAES